MRADACLRRLVDVLPDTYKTLRHVSFNVWWPEGPECEVGGLVYIFVGLGGWRCIHPSGRGRTCGALVIREVRGHKPSFWARATSAHAHAGPDMRSVCPPASTHPPTGGQRSAGTSLRIAAFPLDQANARQCAQLAGRGKRHDRMHVPSGLGTALSAVSNACGERVDGLQWAGWVESGQVWTGWLATYLLGLAGAAAAQRGTSNVWSFNELEERSPFGARCSVGARKQGA